MGWLSEDFVTTSGVRQGDALSPLLFNLALEFAVRLVLQRIDPGVLVYAYANDIVIVAESRQKLQKAMEELIDQCSALGLQVNQGKTKYVAATPTFRVSAPDLEVRGHTYESVPSFKYLGSYLTPDNSQQTHPGGHASVQSSEAVTPSKVHAERGKS